MQTRWYHLESRLARWPIFWLRQLSAEDVRLLALAYTYEVEIYGDAHLKRFPGTIRAHSRRPAAARMPGWGETGNDEDWEAIDQVQDAGA